MRTGAAFVRNAAQHLRPHPADHLQRAGATNRRGVLLVVDEERGKRASSPQHLVSTTISILAPQFMFRRGVISPQRICKALQQGEQILGCAVSLVTGKSIAHHEIVVAAGIRRQHVGTRREQEEHVVGQRLSHVDEVSSTGGRVILDLVVEPAQVELGGDVPPTWNRQPNPGPVPGRTVHCSRTAPDPMASPSCS